MLMSKSGSQFSNKNNMGAKLEKEDQETPSSEVGKSPRRFSSFKRSFTSRRNSMGKHHSKIPPSELRDLLAHTHFTEQELKEWYGGFRRDCPDGMLSLDQFTNIYSDFYGTSEAKRFAEHLFRTFDVNQDGKIDFREFICSLSVTTRGTFKEKLRWAFMVYDVDMNGVISKHEVLTIVKSINKMMGNNINDKNASEQRIMSIFSAFDKNKDQMLSLEEFIEGARRDPTFVKMLQCNE